MSIPNTENELRQMLLERMQQEYDAFIERLLLQAPEVILRASYEKVFKEDIMQIVENGSLAPEHVRALLKEKNPLEGCYQNWLREEETYMENLQNSVEKYAKDVILKI